MHEKYLVINAGSSSLKFSLYEMPENVEIVNGLIERIGEEGSCYTLKANGEKIKKESKISNHNDAVTVMMNELLNNGFINSYDEIKGIGHRVLHGGEIYSSSVVIDDEVLNNIKKLTKLGPLHHPGEIAGIMAMKNLMPDVCQVAVFDTAFHQTMPKENYMYAVPYEWYQENGVRKYGFHGTSHKYITEYLKNYYNNDHINAIICHIGSGASISCVKEGKCFDTTMGLTPLDGLVMGTRSGSIDPSIIEYICKERNLTVEEVTTLLNKKSGLLGVGTKNDFRDIESLATNGDERASLALALFKNSIKKYIGNYYFELNGDVDAIVFTAGAGENAANLRAAIVNEMSKPLGIKLDSEKNNSIASYKETKEGKITTDDSKIDVLVIPTNEEYMILKDTYDLANQKVKKLVR